MASPLNRLHRARILDQVVRALIEMQRAMVANAKTHKAIAQAQSLPQATLRAQIVDSGQTYNRFIGYVEAAIANKPTLFSDALEVGGITTTDITEIVTHLRSAYNTLSSMPRQTYAEMIALCDAIIALVDAPESIWPE